MSIQRTRYLIGTQLDLAFAKAEGIVVLNEWQSQWTDLQFTNDWFLCKERDAIIKMEFDSTYSRSGVWREVCRFSPSTDPSQIWPIIDREEIAVVPTGDASKWKAYTWNKETQDFTDIAYGQTSLIAAARCFVELKLGKEVDTDIFLSYNTDIG